MGRYGSFGIRLHGYDVLAELPRSSPRTRSFRVRPQLHEDIPRYMAPEEACYVLKCVDIGQIGTPKPKSRSNSTEAQLVREVNALLKLRHANLVPYYKVFVQDRRLCTMAGFCSLGSFHDLFEAIKSGLEWASEFCVSSDTKEKAIAPRLVWHFLIQVLEGLEQLHKCSIIHRFIKPRNLLLEPETTFTHPDFKWRVRIADVAVPEMLRREAKLRPQKVRYLAPELISGNNPFDVKTDMWSLGCVLFELVSMRRAFHTAADISSRSLNPLPLNADENAVELINALLSADPEARPDVGGVLALPHVAQWHAEWPFAAWFMGDSLDATSEDELIRPDAEGNSSPQGTCWAKHPADGLWYPAELKAPIASTPSDCFNVYFQAREDEALCWHDAIKPFRKVQSEAHEGSVKRTQTTLKSGVVVGFGRADVAKLRVSINMDDTLSSIEDEESDRYSDVDDALASNATSRRSATSGSAPRFSMLGRLLPNNLTDGADSIVGTNAWSGRTNHRSVGEVQSGKSSRRCAPASGESSTNCRDSVPAFVSEQEVLSKRDTQSRLGSEQLASTDSNIRGSDLTRAGSAKLDHVPPSDMNQDVDGKKSAACTIL